MSEFQWVSDSEQLSLKVEEWLEKPFIALDTEFERTNTFFAKPGLLQVADGESVTLIDPLAVSDLERVAPVLTSLDTVVVMHSMSEDVELLQNVAGVYPERVFDTQIAAAFLGYGASLGYQALVKNVLDVELDKSETRSDWLQRPLSDTQISYAVKDTEYLSTLYERLRESLAEAGLLAACLDETKHLIEQSRLAKENAEEAYLKLRGAWALGREQQARLKQLVCWRDAIAESENLPKSWVFSDALLISFAERAPSNTLEMNRLKGIRHKSIRQFGDALIEQLSLPLENDLSSLVLVDGPLKGLEMDSFRKLKKVVKAVSEKTGIAEQLLGSRKLLEQVVVGVQRKGNEELPLAYQGWRSNYLQQPFLDILAS
jgi:ribonuclease D